MDGKRRRVSEDGRYVHDDVNYQEQEQETTSDTQEDHHWALQEIGNISDAEDTHLQDLDEAEATWGTQEEKLWAVQAIFNIPSGVSHKFRDAA